MTDKEMGNEKIGLDIDHAIHYLQVVGLNHDADAVKELRNRCLAERARADALAERLEQAEGDLTVIRNLYALAAPVPASQDDARDAIAGFAGAVLEAHRDGCGDLDGCWLQETAEQYGLIEDREVVERCGAWHCDCSPGDTCYFLTDAGRAAILAAKKEG